MKTVLVLGGTGATGRLVVQNLLEQGHKVIAIVRREHECLQPYTQMENYQQIIASISEMKVETLMPHMNKCDAVMICLGHNLTFNGIYKEPRKLVTGAVQLCKQTIEQLQTTKKIKVMLMVSSGVSNRDIQESAPVSQRLAVGLIRTLLPPHADNEQAADVLRVEVGQEHDQIEWVAVRPDALTNDMEHAYDMYISPIRNVIFNSGKTSRMNVARVMTDMLDDDLLWSNWRGQMPVVYDNMAAPS